MDIFVIVDGIKVKVVGVLVLGSILKIDFGDE